jgi:hypothetical protein
MKEGALILYGRGGGLGNFKFFADDLKRDLEKKFSKDAGSVFSLSVRGRRQCAGIQIPVPAHGVAPQGTTSVLSTSTGGAPRRGLASVAGSPTA